MVPGVHGVVPGVAVGEGDGVCGVDCISVINMKPRISL